MKSRLGVVTLAGLAVLLAGCAGAPDIRREGALETHVAAAPPVLRHGLELPARIGLARVVAGRLTPVPGVERARWAGALAQVNAQLLYPLRLVALPPGSRVVPAAAGADTAQAEIAALLDRALRQRLDAVLIYELSTRVEGDRLAAGLAELPLFGGILPRTVSTEAHGTALAVLVEPASRAVMGHASARMNDRVLSGLRHSEGDGAAMAPMAAYAMTHVLAPRVEDMLTGAASGGF